MVFLGLSWAQTIDRMAGLQDLQDRVLWLSWALTMSRITGFTGFFSCSKDLIYEQFEWITDD